MFEIGKTKLKNKIKEKILKFIFWGPHEYTLK